MCYLIGGHLGVWDLGIEEPPHPDTGLRTQDLTSHTARKNDLLPCEDLHARKTATLSCLSFLFSKSSSQIFNNSS
jgi:hypothetical protein